MEEEQKIHKKRSIAGIVATIIVLILMGAFTYRVIYFTNLINSGDIATLDLIFADSLTLNETVNELVMISGAVDVFTADDPTLGNPEALIKVVEFADFGCPYCKEASNTVRALAAKYPEKIYYQYRDYPVDELHPEARMVAQAAACAHAQDKFWEFHDKAYQMQSSLSEEKVSQIAEEIGVDMREFDACVSSETYADEVEEDYQDGIDVGVIGTPTFFINGNKIPGAIPYEIFESLIEQNS
jgi:protein-disulfide isomerase